jgi:hypothetical protein
MLPDSSSVWLRLLCNTAKRPLPAPIQEGKTPCKSVNFCADGYLLGSYRIATAPEPNSSRVMSLKSICFDSTANTHEVLLQRANWVPISGRAGAAPALEPQEAYPPARSAALAGYAAAPLIAGRTIIA